MCDGNCNCVETKLSIPNCLFHCYMTHNFSKNEFHRKITDDIEKCEERLEILETEKKDKVEKLEHFENVYNEAKKTHDKNSKVLERIKSSGEGKSKNLQAIVLHFFQDVLEIAGFPWQLLLLSS